MMRVDEPLPKCSTLSVSFVRGRNTALLASEKFTTNCPFRYTRSPVSPCSATSGRSLAPISRPSGILPGGNVFQLPPPALDARATLEASAGTGFAGRTGTGVAVGIGEAWATGAVSAPGTFRAGAGATAGTFGTFGGVRADAAANGVGLGATAF